MNQLHAILLSVALLSLLVGCSRLAPPATAGAQIKYWCKTDRDSFRLAEIGELPHWSAVHIFGPYTTIQTIEGRLGFEWADAADFGIHERDDIYLAVFIAEDEVVRVETWDRSYFVVADTMTQSALKPETVVEIDRSRSKPRLTLAEAVVD